MPKTITTVEDLDVLNKAYQASLALHELSLKWPKYEQYGGLADQIRRSSKGICANLAEGFGKQANSKAEFRRYISIALGSADETRIWLRYTKDLGYLSDDKAQLYQAKYQEIAKMLTGLYKNWS